MASTAVEQLRRERPTLMADNDAFKVFINDDDPTKFVAFIKGPEESIYQHKLLKFNIEIPPTYPQVSMLIVPYMVYSPRKCEARLIIFFSPKGSSDVQVCPAWGFFRTPQSTP